MILGCKKDTATPEMVQKSYDVVFTVSDFSQKTVTNTTASSDSIRSFRYYIYNNAGALVIPEERELTTSPTSVNLKVKLPAGQYKFVFFASPGGLSIYPDGPTPLLQNLNYPNIFDTFNKIVNVTVGTENINQNITLSRMNSALEIQFLDQYIPDNIVKLEIVWRDSKYVDFDGQSVQLHLNQKNIVLKTGSTVDSLDRFFTYVFNTSYPTSIYFVFRDLNGNAVGTREIKNIVFYKNKKTILTGYLFQPSDAEFNAAVNPVWENPTEFIPF